MVLRIVVFPEPDGPNRATISWFTENETSSKKSGNCFWIETFNMETTCLICDGHTDGDFAYSTSSARKSYPFPVIR